MNKNLVGRKILAIKDDLDITKGNIYKIVEVDNIGFDVVDDAGDQTCFGSDYLDNCSVRQIFELIDKVGEDLEEGETIIAIKDASCITKGESYIIERIASNGFVVEDDEEDEVYFSMERLDENSDLHLFKISESFQKKYKKGNLVLALKDELDVTKGETYQIVRTDIEGAHILDDSDEMNFFNFTDFEEFFQLVDGENQDLISKDEDLTPEFEVGMEVKAIKDLGSWITKNEVYKIIRVGASYFDIYDDQGEIHGFTFNRWKDFFVLKSDLKKQFLVEGNMIITRGNRKFIITKDKNNELKMFDKEYGFSISFYDDLTDNCLTEFDIMKVYDKPHEDYGLFDEEGRLLLWERNEPVTIKITKSNYEKLKAKGILEECSDED
ncbi:MAG: hypothetical protein ACOC1K_05330 [Nanoarchaeota archaeon]